MTRQCIVIHLSEGSNGSVGLTVMCDPPIETDNESRVPGNVEAIARRMINAAEKSPAQIGPTIDALPWEKRL